MIVKPSMPFWRCERPVVVNLWAPPGVGKTTTMAALFAILKHRAVRVEMAPEFAKEMAYESNEVAFRDQFYLMARQEYRLSRLVGQVDYIITDSPPMLCYVFAAWGEKPLITRLNVEYRKRYKRTVDVRLQRNPERLHQTYGRKHTREQSLALEQEVDAALLVAGGPHLCVVSDDAAAPKIIHWLEQEGLLSAT